MTETAKIVLIYHFPCQDGFAAAWVAHNALSQPRTNDHGEPLQPLSILYFPTNYGPDNPRPTAEDVRGRDVIMLDFSYPKEFVDKLIPEFGAKSVLILDHHETAANALKDYLPAINTNMWRNYYRRQSPYKIDFKTPMVIFDMERSGAQIAWDFFWPNRIRPLMIDHIGDRDRWQFKIEHTAAISAWLFSHPYKFELWDRLNAQLGTHDGYRRAVEAGEAIARSKTKDIQEFISKHATAWRVQGYDVPVCNVPYSWASEAAGYMAQTAPFAVAYYDSINARYLSLRSRGAGGVNVAEIAKALGAEFNQTGGGHAGAAGTQVPLDWRGDGTHGTARSSRVHDPYVEVEDVDAD